MCNGAAKQISAGNAPFNIKCRNLFGNVETCLKMSHGRLISVSDWLTQRRVTRASETSFTKWCYMVKLLFFHHCDCCKPLHTEVESGSTFRETCLATDVRKSFTKPTNLHGATPAETCFAAPLHTISEHLNLKKAGLASRNIVLKYITLCQPCSSLCTSHRYFSSLAY